jgi:AraC family cel operon transcriptional repressor
MFWIEQGNGWHDVTAKGSATNNEVTIGDGCFLAPGCQHRLRAADQALVWCNIAISSDLMEHWRQRYSPVWQTWPWPKENMAMHRFDEGVRRRLVLALDHVSPKEFSLSPADAWCLQLWQVLTATKAAHKAVPTWLSKALASLRSPQGLQEGVGTLVRLSGRTHDHLARTVKLCYGTTPSLLVRAARLEYAAVQLRTTSDSILDIALDCGFENASYFTRSFKQQYGHTPRAYRQGYAAIGSPIAS